MRQNVAIRKEIKKHSRTHISPPPQRQFWNQRECCWNGNLRVSASSAEEPISSSERLPFRIDQRVHFAGDPRRIGTVRYVGPVEGHSGIWVGVDWDNRDGKHDGSVNGIRYFEAKCEKSGSFVRPHNLSSGISFLEALILRYRGDSTKEEEEEMYVLSARNNRVAIQLVGKDKVQEKLSHFDELHRVSLSYLGISLIGPLQQIKTTVPSKLNRNVMYLGLMYLQKNYSVLFSISDLKELDLTGNLLSDWKDVGAICEALPALEVLNLTNNIMKHDLTKLPSVKSLHILVLNNCSVAWKEDEPSADVRLSENPIADPGQGGIPRFVLIARLAKVEILNGSEISLRERKESEIRYVRLVMSKSQSENEEELKQQHPRFAELKVKHGIEDEKASATIAGPPKMASGLLSITLKCIGASLGEKPPLVKNLPATTTIGKLKILCESFFKLKSVRLKLFLLEERARVGVVPGWVTERKVLSATPLGSIEARGNGGRRPVGVGPVGLPLCRNKSVRVGWADVGGAEAWASYQSIGTQSG
ncbi:hypothetical protein ACLOJK_014199 [Asimina triloba]